MSRLITVHGNGEVAAEAGQLQWLRPEGDYSPEQHFLVGLLGGQPIFVTGSPREGPTESLRTLSLTLSDSDREVATAGVALVNWHRVAQHCGVCGSLTEVRAGGLVRHCPGCLRDRFPRTDPAVIVAVVDSRGRLLLGRHAGWQPVARRSLLAGFVSAGESLEGAVRREVAEEAGISVGAVRYLSSQPWPFPRSLMVGFVASALTTDIVVDGEEIVEAGWYDRDGFDAALTGATLVLPGQASIAHRLITAWRGRTLPSPDS